MGGSSSKYNEVPLYPQNPPVVAVDERFALPQPVTLVLREKIFSFSGDDFSIKDATTGQPYFRVNGRALSLREKKTFLDAYGQPIMNMKSQLLAFVPNNILYYGDDSRNKLAEIRAHFTFMKPKLSVKFNNKINGVPCELGCKGNWLARSCIIWLDVGCKGEANRVTVAKITSPLITGRNMLWDKQ